MKFKRLLLPTALATCISTLTNAQTPVSPAEEANFNERVHSYLLSHPEVLLEMSTALKAKQDQIAEQSVKDAITANADSLYRDSADPVVGPAKGAMTLVEFLDYNCGYCKQSWGTVKALLKAQPELRYVYKAYPILSDGSVLAAQASLAVNKLHPEKFFAFHDALMSFPEKIDNERTLAELATSVGLSWEEIRTHLSDQDIDAHLRKIHTLGRDMSVTGTPAFFSGDQMLGGAPRAPEDLLSLLQRAKQQ